MLIFTYFYAYFCFLFLWFDMKLSHIRYGLYTSLLYNITYFYYSTTFGNNITRSLNKWDCIMKCYLSTRFYRCFCILRNSASFTLCRKAAFSMVIYHVLFFDLVLPYFSNKFMYLTRYFPL